MISDKINHVNKTACYSLVAACKYCRKSAQEVTVQACVMGGGVGSSKNSTDLN